MTDWWTLNEMFLQSCHDHTAFVVHKSACSLCNLAWMCVYNKGSIIWPLGLEPDYYERCEYIYTFLHVDITVKCHTIILLDNVHARI